MPAIPPSPQDAPRPTVLSPLQLEEYAALRATIRERGSIRVVLMVSTVAAWGALAMAIRVWLGAPWASLLPLVVLTAGFEAVFALHVGVERIGRFLQVVYEGHDEDRLTRPTWEHCAMRFGQAAATGPRVDPLFTGLFVTAVAVNVLPAAWDAVTGQLSAGAALTLGVVHLLPVVRMLQARAYAARQRALDLTALTVPVDQATEKSK